jgi:RNA-directed DNA polymerase
MVCISRLRRWGTEAQRTHRREGEAGQNTLMERKMGDTSRSLTISTKLQQIAQQAKQYPTRVFTTLAHLIDVEFLGEAFARTRKDAAPGIDGVTAEQYAENLTANLTNLHERLRSGSYTAPPVKRKWLDKDDGKKRPIGIPTFEDKVLQRAVVMLLGAIYEQDFYRSSHGFREGHSAHQALHEVREQCLNMNVGWIVDADVTACFDSLDHSFIREIIKQRVNDGAILRLIGKWLNAGVMEGEALSYPEAGSPQGGVVSPMIANIYLHHVLDEWFIKEVKPRMKGRCFLTRFADDFVVGCELEADAYRIMEVLPKRFARFSLAIHPDKTKLIKFRKPDNKGESDKSNGTFDFLGFTHYWTKSRRGYWVIKRQTANKRLRRAMKRVWQWCQKNRHTPLAQQYRKLSQKLKGHYQYYGIRGNYEKLASFFTHVDKAWRYWLSRRSSESNIPWEKFHKLQAYFPLPKPRIVKGI